MRVRIRIRVLESEILRRNHRGVHALARSG